MKYSDIIGQDAAIDILKKAFMNKRDSHAYLFTGPGGVGKRNTAIAFAQLLNCAEVQEDLVEKNADSCDECISCRKIKNGNHPDVELVTAEEDKKNISVEQIHELQKRIALKSMEGRKKVYIIDDANDMNKDSANCLLKTLEEPNEDVVIILIARNIYGLLPTIRSRCQILKFKAIAEKSIKEILINKHNLNAEKAAFIAELAQGRLGVAEMYADEGMEAVIEMTERIVEAIKRKKAKKAPNYEKIFSFTDGIYRKKDEVSDLLNCLLVSLRRLFIQAPSREMVARLEAVLNAQNLIARNINTQTALNDMMIKLV